MQLRFAAEVPLSLAPSVIMEAQRRTFRKGSKYPVYNHRNVQSNASSVVPFKDSRNGEDTVPRRGGVCDSPENKFESHAEETAKALPCGQKRRPLSKMPINALDQVLSAAAVPKPPPVTNRTKAKLKKRAGRSNAKKAQREIMDTSNSDDLTELAKRFCRSMKNSFNVREAVDGTWDALRSKQFRSLCEKLGFSCRTMGDDGWKFSIRQQHASGLRSELAIWASTNSGNVDLDVKNDSADNAHLNSRTSGDSKIQNASGVDTEDESKAACEKNTSADTTCDNLGPLDTALAHHIPSTRVGARSAPLLPVPSVAHEHWTPQELQALQRAVKQQKGGERGGKSTKMLPKHWKKVQLAVGTKTEQACRLKWEADRGGATNGRFAGSRDQSRNRAKARGAARRLSMAYGAGRRSSIIGSASVFACPEKEGAAGMCSTLESRRSSIKIGRVSESAVTEAAVRSVTVADSTASTITVGDFCPRMDEQPRVAWKRLQSSFPHGNFLGDGAHKMVYRVWNEVLQRYEAVSVQNMQESDERLVETEISISWCLSELVEKQHCPCFVRMFENFKFAYDAPWGQESNTKAEYTDDKSAPIALCDIEPGDEGVYQYIRMELCTKGNAEDFIREQPDTLLPLPVVQHMLFQMLFAMHSAQHEINLRHYDVKLLNFFLTTFDTSGTSQAKGVTRTRFGVNGQSFLFELPSEQAVCVKLADVESAETGKESMVQGVEPEHFQTLENTPIDYLLHGRGAKQDFSGDAFALGLCMLHLFTGDKPYEEILEDVRCPKPLMKELTAIWSSEEKPFDVVNEVLSGIDDASADVLHHTLYRYIVLFGLPDEGKITQSLADSPVWKALLKTLAPQGRASRKFAIDSARFSLATGTNIVISRCRERLNASPGALDLLHSLVDFDATRRPSMADAMLSPLFHRDREGSKRGWPQVPSQLSFMEYFSN